MKIVKLNDYFGACKIAEPRKFPLIFWQYTKNYKCHTYIYHPDKSKFQPFASFLRNDKIRKSMSSTSYISSIFLYSFPPPIQKVST